MALPLAHVGHYLWVLYLVPVLIVAGAIVRSFLLQRREHRDEGADAQPPPTETP